MPPQADVSILLKAVDGSWTRIGSDDNRGIVPEGLSLSANEAGPDTCSFTLRRVAHLPWPDLLAFNQCEVWIGGVLVWGGRIWEAPLSDAEEDMIAVQGRGWQYHLDDDLLTRCYALTDLTRFVDARSKPTAVIAVGTLRAAAQVQVGSGVIVLGFAQGFGVGLGDTAGVVLDLGESFIERVVVTFTQAASADAGNTFYVRASDQEYAHATVSSVDDAATVLSSASGTTTTVTLTASPLARYLHLFWYRNGGSGTYLADALVQVWTVKTFSSTSYESGNASILKASDVVEDVLASGALPLLDSTTEAIQTSSFSIPEFAPQGRQTPRALLEAVNAYENNLVGVDARRRLFFRERPTTASLEVGAWSGSSFQDSSTGSGESLYNRVIVQGAGPDGAPLEVARRPGDGTGLSAHDTGAITNGTFEVDTSGWSVVSSVGSIARSSAAAQAGTWSLLITNHSPSGYFYVSTTASGLVEGRTYSLRLWWRAVTAGPIGEINADVFADSLAGDVLASVRDESRNLTFTEQRLSFVGPASGTVVLYLHGFSYASGIPSYYIDTVNLYAIDLGMIDRQGFTRTALLPVQSAMTNTAATQIADLWLAERYQPPFKGSAVISGIGCRRAMGGNIHPSELLLQVGERVRFGHLPDPTTGASAREGTIKSVSYNHDEQSASVELDNERGRLTALLERLAVVTGQIAG